MMKVQLIVVRGKPEGKIIPLVGSTFRVGRGEGCHLRPNSEQVSRQHAEVVIGDEAVVVRDLGSRNGTILNGTAISGESPLKNGDLLQIGPLTFAVSIVGLPAAETPGPEAARAPLGDEASHAEIDSWLVSDSEHQTPDRPSGVYGGETLTFSAYQEAAKSDPNARKAEPPSSASQPAAKPPSSASQPAARPPSSTSQPAAAKKAEPPSSFEAELENIERLPEGEGDIEPEPSPHEEEAEDDEETFEELVDENNPFYVAKKKDPEPEPASSVSKAAPSKDSSAAADEILKRMLDRRRAR